MQTWTWSWAIRNFLAELLMPPGLWIALALLALWVFRKRQALQKITIVLALLMIWVTSTSVFTEGLVRVSNLWMKWPTPLDITSLQAQVNQSSQPQAIVVLGGGRRKGALESPEYGQQDLSKDSLERVRYAAKLAKQTHLPILITGGMPDQTSPTDHPEAVVMGQVLKQEFHQGAKWIEDQSATTQENAAFAAKILKQEGIQHIYLVTHFWHMPRAQKIFEQQNLTVVPAPHGFESKQTLTPFDFYPSSSTKTRQVWHELLGQVWYQIPY